MTNKELREITSNTAWRRRRRHARRGGGEGGGPRSGRRGSERDLRRRCRQDDSGCMTALAGWLRRCLPDTTESRKRRTAPEGAPGSGSCGGRGERET